jgi:tetratricopeptide (TPR) repeat protein
LADSSAPRAVTPLASCPRCHFAQPTASECPRCGVVFAKLERPKPDARNAASLPADEDEPSARRIGWLDTALAVAFVGAVALIAWRWKHPPLPTAATASAEVEVDEYSPGAPPRPGEHNTPRPVARALLSAPAGAAQRPAWALPAVALPIPRTQAYTAPAAIPSPVSPQDGPAFMAVARAASAAQDVDASVLDQAATLHARYPNLRELDRALEALFENAASQANARGRRDEAVHYREQLAELLPDKDAVWLRLIGAHEQQLAWPDAERAARRALAQLPDASSLHLALARALSRQGRDEDAADVLRRRLTARSDPAARAMLAQLEASLASVAGLAHCSSSHFSVTFEGQADDALGRSLVETLEEKRTMLARILDYEPPQPIPVILYSREAFLKTGAASWSGANFSNGDGRIRVGTRGVSAGFVPIDLERTLTHELTHAFVFGLTHGALTPDLNEGLAQYLAGKRLGYRLDPSRAVRTGERVKVVDFYDSALSFVEYLIDRYRQPAMNDLLKYTGETGSVDQGFHRAYRQGYEETRQEWIKSLHAGG